MCVCACLRVRMCVFVYVCVRACVCVRVCARVHGERERERGVRTSFSPKRGSTEREFRFYYYGHFVDAWRACVCVLAVGQALETPCSSYIYIYIYTVSMDVICKAP